MKNEFKIIYLNVGEETEKNEDFKEFHREFGENITWCEDKIFPNDIKYINYKEHLKTVKKLREKIKAWKY